MAPTSFMSENILIGKSRKTGQWEILVDPSETYDAHLKAYQKIAASIPVNDTYSRVLLGRVQNTSSPLSLVTSKEKAERDDLLKSSASRATTAGVEAEERQAKLTAQTAERAAEAHSETIDEKNAMVNKIRKATGQEVFSKTKTEVKHEELQEKLKTPTAAKKVEAEKVLTHAEELVEKNKLTEEVKDQASKK